MKLKHYNALEILRKLVTIGLFQRELKWHDQFGFFGLFLFIFSLLFFLLQVFVFYRFISNWIFNLLTQLLI